MSHCQWCLVLRWRVIINTSAPILSYFLFNRPCLRWRFGGRTFQRRRGWRPKTRRCGGPPRRWVRKQGINFLRLRHPEGFTLPPTSLDATGHGRFNNVTMHFTLRHAWIGKDDPGTSIPWYLWDYYRIRKVKVEMFPNFKLNSVARTRGTTVIDLDGNLEKWSTIPQSFDLYEDRSSARNWFPHSRQKRYFTPKPKLSGINTTPDQSVWFQPNNPRDQMWIHCKDDLVPHLGMGWSLYIPDNQTSYRILLRVTYHIQFGEFQLTANPNQSALER